MKQILCARLKPSNNGSNPPSLEEFSLEEIAQRMMRFSPVVAVEGPDAVVLDVTGSQRLFRGMDRLLRLVSNRLTKLRLPHGVAIAPTLGAAWALASFGNGRIVSKVEEIPAALLPLPVSALRLEEEMIRALLTLGIATIGQLIALPRQTLPARFGGLILTRLSQLFGDTSEPLVRLRERETIAAEMRFDYAIQSQEMLLEVFRRLLEQVLDQLRRCGCGMRTLIVECFLRDASIHKTISLPRPTRDAVALFNLLRCAMEAIAIKAQGTNSPGFYGLRLSVPVFERLSDDQLQLLKDEAQATQIDLDHLIARLRIRLGEGNVLFPQPVQLHLPEQSFQYSSQSSARLGSPQAVLGSTKLTAGSPQSLLIRPLHLLPLPAEIRCMASPSELPCSFTLRSAVFQVAHCTGPERICGPWWMGRDKTRDYFDVEESGGRRFWLFRVAETRGGQALRNRWFLHGFFD